MKQTKQHIGLAALILAGALTACGGNSNGNTNPGGTPGTTNPGGNTGNTGYRSKLAACPILHTSEDPGAVSCLVGTYSGTTLSGAACSLTIRADRSYDFKSPNLNYTYTPNANSYSLFDHANPAGNSHQVIWGMHDHIQADPYYTLDFLARFGSDFPASEQYIEIKAKPSNQGEVNCRISL